VDWKNERGDIVLWPILLTIAVIALVIAAIKVSIGSDPTVVPVATSGVCHCPDVPTMEKRLKEANDAAAEYNKMIQAEGDNPRPFSEGLYQQGKAAVGKAITKPGGTPGSGETHGDDCTTKINNAPNDCIRDSLQTHENLHAAKCLDVKHSERDPGGDYRNAETIVTYWREEAAGYEAEAAFLRNQIAIANLEPPCYKPPTKIVEASSPGEGGKRQQQEMLARARRRVTDYVQTIRAVS
jgi:hypothetical protein